MKTKSFLVFFILSIFVFGGNAQSCLPEGIIFYTQSDINNFANNYPGCTEIEGDVTIKQISSSLAITNLDGLSPITYIGGDFIIKKMVDTLFGGLDNLVHIGGDFKIKKNSNLRFTSLSGFNSLEYIGGDFYIEDNSWLNNFSGFNNLDTIGNDFYIYDNYILHDFSGFNNLQYIGNNFIVDDNQNLTTFSGFESLVFIGGDFQVLSNDDLTTFSGFENLVSIDKKFILGGYPNNNIALANFPVFESLFSVGEGFTLSSFITNISGFNNLNSIGGDFIALGCIDSGFHNLNFIGNDFRVHSCLSNFLEFESLTSIGGDFRVSNNHLITNFSGLENLNTIGGSFNILNDSLTNFNGLENLISIGGNFIIGDHFAYANVSLINFSGLESLTFIGEDFALGGNNNFTNLEGLESLNSIGGDFIIGGSEDFSSSNMLFTSLSGVNNLDSIGGSLTINHLPNLENLTGLENLTSVRGALVIQHLPNLENLIALENLKSIRGALIIQGNTLLTSLNGIQNINPNSIESSPPDPFDIVIYSNPMLSECGVQSICDALAIPDLSTGIYSNALGCNSVDEIDCVNTTISGYIFYDFNENKIKDDNEAGISDLSVWSTPLGQSILSNQDGKYWKSADSDSIYTLTFVENSDWILTTDSTSYTILFESGNPANSNNNFGIIPTFSTHKGTINLSSTPNRCNTEVDFSLRYQNTGTFIESGQIKLIYDSTTTFISANPLPDEIDEDNNSLIWNYTDAYPFQYGDFDIRLAMPDENSTGESIHFVAEIHRDSMNELALLESYFYSPIVLCSFDPNDKQVMPAGVWEEHYTLHDEKLTYTIRFQNTGNAAAIDIKILDTLSTHLDINTFRVVNSSFPVQTSIHEHAVAFYFNNIWLPDSLSNEAASHGFVTYEIKPIEGLDDYAEIENTAYIIFDFNPAIITNTTQNTMVTEIPTGTREIEKNPISIYPNPTSKYFYIQSREGKPIYKIAIYNAFGQKVLQTKETKIDVSLLPNGLYILNIEMDNSIVAKKLLIQR